MEHITVAGHPDPIPASPVAAALLQQRLEAAREKRSAEEAKALEVLVGKRLGTILEDGTPSIDLATMRAVVQFAELPEDEDTSSGVERALNGIRDKLSRRGYSGGS